MTVPCGKCPECIQQKRAEWSLRSAVEFDYCTKNGGYVYFDTLTYRDRDIPRYREHACFLRKHLQDFLKRIRKRIAKDYGIKERAFRYFYVSEYGHEHKRPHYHILFFVPGSFPYTALKKYIKEEWIYGFTDLNSVKFPFRGVVQNQFCCEYVAKYVSKPDNYISSLYDHLKDELSKDEFRRYFHPFHQQSTGFGEALLFDKKNLEHFKEMFCIFNRKKYTLPVYYVRKLYYNLVTNSDGSQSWRENDLGCQFIPQYKYALYEDYTERLRAFVDAVPQYLTISKVYHDVKLFLDKDADLFSENSVSDFSSIDSICKFFRCFDSDFLSRYSYWCRFVKGYLIQDDSFHPLINFTANEKVLIELDCFTDVDRHLLTASLDASTEKEFLFFDKLLTVIRSSLGELDKNVARLKEKTRKLFNYLDYGN